MSIAVERFDAAIVGAGPAGSSAAIFLAQQGYSVALLDKSLFPRDKLCGDFLNPVNWPLFERLGIQNGLLSFEHAKVEAFRISTPSVEAAVPFTPGNGRCAFGLGLRRSLFDDLLLGRACTEGVAVKLGGKLATLSREGDGWNLSQRTPSGEEKIQSRLLIGADGRNSWVAHRLSLTAPRERSGRFVAFQIHLEGCRGLNGEVQIHLFPGGYAGLVGLGGAKANLCFTVEKDQAKTVDDVESLLTGPLFQNPHLRKALEGSKTVGEPRSAYPVYFSPRRCYGDGFLLIGDAARVTEPVTGEGIFFALKSGAIAAAAADSAFRAGDLSACHLSDYDRACRGVLSRRQRLNRLVRAAVYRPYLVTPLLQLSPRSGFPVNALVRLVCEAPP